jgi:hypothetical protein
MTNRIVLPRWRGLRPLYGRVDRARASLLSRAGAAAPVLDPVGIETKLESFPRYDQSRTYAQVKPNLAAIHAQISEDHGHRVALWFGLGMLVHLIGSHERRWRSSLLDDRLKPEFVDSFHRILDAVERGGSRSMSMTTDNFAKDFTICLHRLIPAGGQLIDPGSGVPRSILLRSRARSLTRTVGYLLLTCRGFRPFAELHTHERMRHLFTPKGWEYCFRLMPAVFRSYPHLKGVVGGSWFFDPQLEFVTPSLSFVREVAARWGGLIVRDAVNSATTANALAMSEHRRGLYAEGRYQPVSYLMVAARSRILAHARITKISDNETNRM